MHTVLETWSYNIRGGGERGGGERGRGREEGGERRGREEGERGVEGEDTTIGSFSKLCELNSG